MKRGSLLALAAAALSLSITPMASLAQASSPAATGKPSKASAASPAAGLSRQQVLTLVRRTCPQRMGELLSKAMPTQQASRAQVAEACTCMNAKVRQEPNTVGPEELQHESTYHALNCARPLVRDYNAAWVHNEFGPYLLGKQGWKAESVNTLALCLADTLWNQNHNPDRHGKGLAPSGSDFWALCAGNAGHPNESLPSPEALGAGAAEAPSTPP